jgi:hypothetical protein
MKLTFSWQHRFGAVYRERYGAGAVWGYWTPWGAWLAARQRENR